MGVKQKAMLKRESFLVPFGSALALALGLVEFLKEQTNDHISDSGQFCRRWPLLLCGTLNFNGRKGLMAAWKAGSQHGKGPTMAKLGIW